MNNIINITMRDIQTAFNNAINKGLINKPEEYMYMYTKTYEDGSTYDVFKNIMTRRHETVAI